jgi:hypothetical protein
VENYCNWNVSQHVRNNQDKTNTLTLNVPSHRTSPCPSRAWQRLDIICERFVMLVRYVRTYIHKLNSLRNLWVSVVCPIQIWRESVQRWANVHMRVVKAPITPALRRCTTTCDGWISGDRGSSWDVIVRPRTTSQSSGVTAGHRTRSCFLAHAQKPGCDSGDGTVSYDNCEKSYDVVRDRTILLRLAAEKLASSYDHWLGRAMVVRWSFDHVRRRTTSHDIVRSNLLL